MDLSKPSSSLIWLLSLLQSSSVFILPISTDIFDQLSPEEQEIIVEEIVRKIKLAPPWLIPGGH